MAGAQPDPRRAVQRADLRTPQRRPDHHQDPYPQPLPEAQYHPAQRGGAAGAQPVEQDPGRVGLIRAVGCAVRTIVVGVRPSFCARIAALRLYWCAWRTLRVEPGSPGAPCVPLWLVLRSSFCARIAALRLYWCARPGRPRAPYAVRWVGCAVRTRLPARMIVGKNSSPSAGASYARENPGGEDVTAAMLA